LGLFNAKSPVTGVSGDSSALSVKVRERREGMFVGKMPI
jgi:hypothetical protein